MVTYVYVVLKNYIGKCREKMAGPEMGTWSESLVILPTRLLDPLTVKYLRVGSLIGPELKDKKV